MIDKSRNHIDRQLLRALAKNIRFWKNNGATFERTLIKLWSTLATCFQIKRWEYWDVSSVFRGMREKFGKKKNYMSSLENSLSSSINFFPYEPRGPRKVSDEKFILPFLRVAHQGERRRRNLHARLNQLHRNGLRTATWHIALRQNGSLSSFSRGEGGRPLSGCNGRKGFWNMSGSCARKVLCTHIYLSDILRRCTIAARERTPDYTSFFFLSNDRRHDAWLWHFNRGVEIFCVKSCVELMAVTERADRYVYLSVRVYLSFVNYLNLNDTRHVNFSPQKLGIF